MARRMGGGGCEEGPGDIKKPLATAVLATVKK